MSKSLTTCPFWHSTDRRTNRQNRYNNIALCMHCMLTRDRKPQLRSECPQSFRHLNVKNLFTCFFASRYLSSSSEKLNAETERKPDITDTNLSCCLWAAFGSRDRWYSTSCKQSSLASTSLLLFRYINFYRYFEAYFWVLFPSTAVPLWHSST